MVGNKASEEEHKKVESKEGDCKLEDCTEELRMQEGCKEVGHKPEERKPEVEHKPEVERKLEVRSLEVERKLEERS
jgi:hypothetical protein